MKDAIQVNAVVWPVFGVVTLTELELILKVALLALTIAFTVWKWWKAATRPAQKED